MRISCLLTLTLLSVSIAGTLALIEAPIERIDLPSGASNKRYLSDPMAHASVLYAGLLQIGGQNYRLILDTGSGDTFLIASGCTLLAANGSATKQGCSFSTNFYNGNGALLAYDAAQCTASMTYGGQTGRCGIATTYLDGSSIASVARSENLRVGNYTGTTTFGAATNASAGFIVAGTDGIWGMTRPNPAWKMLQNGPLTTLFDAGMNKTFAMCLGTTGGALHLGGYDSSYASGGLKWYTFDPTSYHYDITLTRIAVGTTSISNSGGPLTIDSGSTQTRVPHAVYDSMLDAIARQCTSCNMNVFFSSYYITVDPGSYPTIHLTLTDITGTSNTISLTGAQYLMPNPTDGSQYTSGFYTTSKNTEWIIGQSFMRNWYTVFDIAYGVVGIGSLASGKCTAVLKPPVGSLSTLTPSTAKPPTSTGGLTPVKDSPASRPPITPTPDTAPNPPRASPPSPSQTPTSDASKRDSTVPLISVSLLLFASIF